MMNWQGGPAAQGSLVDVLDRVLDKGLVVAGDIRISLANIELLTVKIRLLVCSVDKAVEIGLDWWRQDGYFNADADRELKQLQRQVSELERKLLGDSSQSEQASPPRRRPRRRRSSEASPGSESETS